MSAITQAVRELERRLTSVKSALNVLRGLEGGGRRGPGRPRGSRGGLSEEGRRRIIEAQRRRWAKMRAQAKKK